ncbi:hypothetical protein KIPB_000899 [Kipferlia bialata]|uniref:Uncharacterized protein n=1 Tax=Kipferlia bialata TaxID=797122 RepID=A0A391NID7_9EUKA|nr:hypothetical protein KIPB_000899 [Kipferlia bialata]|eukprot:g899.t1
MAKRGSRIIDSDDESDYEDDLFAQPSSEEEVYVDEEVQSVRDKARLKRRQALKAKVRGTPSKRRPEVRTRPKASVIEDSDDEVEGEWEGEKTHQVMGAADLRRPALALPVFSSQATYGVGEDVALRAFSVAVSEWVKNKGERLDLAGGAIEVTFVQSVGSDRSTRALMDEWYTTPRKAPALKTLLKMDPFVSIVAYPKEASLAQPDPMSFAHDLPRYVALQTCESFTPDGNGLSDAVLSLTQPIESTQPSSSPRVKGKGEAAPAGACAGPAMFTSLIGKLKESAVRTLGPVKCSTKTGGGYVPGNVGGVTEVDGVRFLSIVGTGASKGEAVPQPLRMAKTMVVKQLKTMYARVLDLYLESLESE